MNDLLDLLTSYRAGQLDRAAFTERLTTAGVDPSDVELLANNQQYTPPGDMADRFIAQQDRRRKAQPNPLMP